MASASLSAGIYLFQPSFLKDISAKYRILHRLFFFEHFGCHPTAFWPPLILTKK